MIKDFLDNGMLVSLITRPRRFRKTLNMSMMADFFDITKDSKQLFLNTQIINTEYVSEMNQYPTIFMSFAGAQGSKEDVIRNIKTQILGEYQKMMLFFKN